MSLLAELKRRNEFKAGAAYLNAMLAACTTSPRHHEELLNVLACEPRPAGWEGVHRI